MNLMTVDGCSAKIEDDSDTDQLRGEILGLNGGIEPAHVRRDIEIS